MKLKILIALSLLFVTGRLVLADNPLVTHIYTADPTARVFNDTLYVYPSHDVPEYDGRTGNNNFFMEDYHVFSTTDLMHFTDHGMILHQRDVDWVDNDSNAMWAPDCVEKDGKYYFYFPGNFKIGVAIADHPTGPFVPVQQPITYANGIDPCVLIDDDGTPYMYFGGGENLKVMRMKQDMITPDMAPITVKNLPAKYKEGSFVFKRNGIYYFTFPHAPGGSEEIAYAMGSNPLGPFEYKGVIMDRWTDGCWTNHHSIVEYKGQWTIFYHHHDLSKDGTLRSMRADKLFFNEDGTIQKVTPTLRGVGIRPAWEHIQVDRYDEASGCREERFQRIEPAGFYVTDITPNAWLKYSGVDFGGRDYRRMTARVACSSKGGAIEVHAGSTSGPLLGTIDVPNTGGDIKWQTVHGQVATAASGVQDLFLLFKSNGDSKNIFRLNWIRFDPVNTFEVNFEGNGAGHIEFDGRTVTSEETSLLFDLEASATYSFSAKASEGSVFGGWKLNGESVDAVSTVAPGDIVTAVFDSEIQGIDAFSRIEAEYFDEQSGVQTENCQEGGQNIGYIENGDWIKFIQVNFGAGARSVAARVASDTNGGMINVYLDDLESSPIASLKVANAGGWQNWTTVTAPVTEAKGVHDLIIQFSGGAGYLFNVNWIEFTKSTTDMGSNETTLPTHYELGQNYPNPFNPSTTFSYTLPQQAHVDLAVYNILGEKVAHLENEIKPAGVHRVEFDSTGLQSGLYVYNLTTPDFSDSKKMMVLK